MGKIGKVANQLKLAIPSHSDPLWWEKIGKVANQAKLAIPSHSEPLQWEKIGKVANLVKLASQSHYEPLWWERLEKLKLRQNPTCLWGGGLHHPEPQCHVDPKFPAEFEKQRFSFQCIAQTRDVCME